MPDLPKWLTDWELAKRVRRLPQDLATDASETIGDLRDEPSEVPYRLRRRVDDYVIPRPRHKVEYPSVKRPK